jgi:hypothetical protein
MGVRGGQRADWRADRLGGGFADGLIESQESLLTAVFGHADDPPTSWQ